MTDLQKYEVINSCDNLEDLASFIERFADGDGMIQGRTQKFSASKMAKAARNFDNHIPNNLTRNWGIRQQAMYIAYYS